MSKFLVLLAFAIEILLAAWLVLYGGFNNEGVLSPRALTFCIFIIPILISGHALVRKPNRGGAAAIGAQAFLAMYLAVLVVYAWMEPLSNRRVLDFLVLLCFATGAPILVAWGHKKGIRFRKFEVNQEEMPSELAPRSPRFHF